MDDNGDRKARYTTADAYTEEFLIKAASSGSSAEREFAAACLSAMRGARQDELFPSRDKFGELSYTAKQGVKAACHGREDAAAILLIQQVVLRRLQGIRIFNWIFFVLLCYIAIRVS